MEYLVVAVVAFFIGVKVSELKNFILDARIERKVSKFMSDATASEPKRRRRMQDDEMYLQDDEEDFEND